MCETSSQCGRWKRSSPGSTGMCLLVTPHESMSSSHPLTHELKIPPKETITQVQGSTRNRLLMATRQRPTVTLEMQLRQNHSHHPLPERERLGLREERDRVMSVLCGDVGCWALESCGAVRLCSLRRVSIYLLHAYKQWEEDICCSSSTTLHSIHFHPTLYPFPLLGQTTLHPQDPFLVSIKLKLPLVGRLGRLAGVSIHFPFSLFGLVHLAPTGRP